MQNLLLFILLTFPLAATAQSHTTFHFSVAEGLPSSEVYEVYQDKKGFLWFATDNGVARYDGHEFELFHVTDGLLDPVVFSFFEDGRDRIWFRSFSGSLTYMEDGKIKAFPHNAQLAKTGKYPFFNFAYDSVSDDLWFSLAHVIGRIEENGETHTQETPEGTFYIKSVPGGLLQGADIRSSIRELIIDGEPYPIQLSDTSENKFFNAIACGDRIYVSIYKDLFEYHRNAVTRILSAAQPIISLSKDKDEKLWIGYLHQGVENYVDKNTRWSPSFLKDKSVTKVYQDASGGVWFTTLESGVYYVPTFQVVNHALPTSSRIKTVLSLENTVLAGDQAGNLFFFDADTGELLSRQTYEDEVYALFQDSYKNVWVSAGSDIMRYDASFKSPIVYPGHIATSFSEGPERWVWAYGGIRIMQFNEAGRQEKWITRTINYRTMLVHDSVIYFAGRTGLHIRDKEMNLRAAPPAFAELKISQIELLNDTTLILATQGNGLVLVNTRTWNYRQFDTNHQFLANNIYCLARTDSSLMAGTEKGLVHVAIESLLDGMPEFHRLFRNTGLVGDQINFVVPGQETIWAFTDDGFSIIPKSFTEIPAEKPIFYFKSIIAGADTLATEKKWSQNHITLPANNNHLTVTFGYISFSNQDMFLRYRISPSSQWVLTTERTLQFLSLAPGLYSFELQYSPDNIRWNTPFEPLAFGVDAPWWMKWYTITGIFIFVFLIGWVYFRYRQSIDGQKNHYLSIINAHQQKLIQSEIETLERERKRIATDLHDGVGTNLTAIKLMVSQLLNNYHVPQAASIEEQFQIALRELKDIIYDLTPPSLGRYGLFTALKNYVSKLNTSLAPVISLQIYGREIRNYEFNIMVFRIVQELISNSIKHSSAKNITIHINSFEDMLNIVYEDDGIGFVYREGSSGLGLDNIESRIRSMNGTFKFASGDHGISYTIDIPGHPIKETA